jgi:autophagy-related protein 5
MSSRDVTSRLRERVWNGSIPLEIRLHKGDCRTYDDSDPYLVRGLDAIVYAVAAWPPTY